MHYPLLDIFPLKLWGGGGGGCGGGGKGRVICQLVLRVKGFIFFVLNESVT